MTELEQIAASVAVALELERMDTPTWSGWISGDDGPSLWADGTRLFTPYWRCRCMDWLRAQGYWLEIAPEDNYESSAYKTNKSIEAIGHGVSLTCPAAEFPARAIDALMRAKP